MALRARKGFRGFRETGPVLCCLEHAADSFGEEMSFFSNDLMVLAILRTRAVTLSTLYRSQKSSALMICAIPQGSVAARNKDEVWHFTFPQLSFLRNILHSLRSRRIKGRERRKRIRGEFGEGRGNAGVSLPLPSPPLLRFFSRILFRFPHPLPFMRLLRRLHSSGMCVLLNTLLVSSVKHGPSLQTGHF